MVFEITCLTLIFYCGYVDSTCMYGLNSFIIGHCLECAISAWTSPVQSGTGGEIHTAILTKADGYTGDFNTFTATTDATSVDAYAIFSQVPDTGIFEIATVTGVLTIGSSKVLDYETAQTHVLQITATDDSSAVGTVTVTIAVTNVAPAFAETTQTVKVADATAASTTVTTLTATDIGATLTYAISTASNTNIDFAISSSGVVTTLNVLASATTKSYSLVITAADNMATILTGTTTLTVCVGCGAAGLAVGVLSLITLAVAMI